MRKSYIILNEKCSANCSFCISKSRSYDKKLELSADKPFLKTDADIIEALSLRGINNFEITGGGEPFLYKNLNERINLIKKINNNAYIKIYTNGNHLKQLDNIDEINISIAHYDDEINKKIMRPSVYIPLDEKLKYFKDNHPKSKLRLSIALLKGGIDTEEKIKTLLELTDNYDLEYVIRTLYPDSPNYDETYIDIEYKDIKIKYEKDNNVDDFNEVIWWSNDVLYANWDLDRQKHLFSYLLLKPDSKTYINEILNDVDSEGYDYELRQYNNIKDTAYLYRDKSIKEQDIIKKHLKALSILFGEEYLLLFLKSNKIESLEEVIKDSLDLKNKLRNKYSLTHAHEGFIKYNGAELHSNLIHSPDTGLKSFEEDLDYLDSLEHRQVNKKELQLMKKLGTYKL